MTKFRRRDFIKIGVASGISMGFSDISKSDNLIHTPVGVKPVVISTWDHGLQANKVAWDMLKQGKKAIDAVQQGVMVVESDPEVRTVGVGGYPDREGKVTLDACIMDENSNCGAVAFLQHIENPIAVARKVMDATPHVMLVGKGALDFALEQGFEQKNLLTKQAQEDWEHWKKESNYQPRINIENHDTISSLALDQHGNLSGACTTSGAAWKMHGRVGDSPIIGAGLFLDNEVGGAAATGLGEAVMRTAGSAMVVEAMRYGKTPQEACEEVTKRIVKKLKNVEDLQVGFLALDKHGRFGAFSIQEGFTYAFCTDTDGHKVKNASYIK